MLDGAGKSLATVIYGLLKDGTVCASVGTAAPSVSITVIVKGARCEVMSEFLDAA